MFNYLFYFFLFSVFPQNEKEGGPLETRISKRQLRFLKKQNSRTEIKHTIKSLGCEQNGFMYRGKPVNINLICSILNEILSSGCRTTVTVRHPSDYRERFSPKTVTRCTARTQSYSTRLLSKTTAKVQV